MKKCKYCQVEVETKKDFCPLCFNHLEMVDNKVEPFYELRKFNETTQKTSNFLYKLFLFLSICIGSVCLIINRLTNPNLWWSLVVIFSVLYVWVLVAHTILSKQSVFKKVLLQILSILILLYFSEKISPSDWLVSYVLPSVSICSVIVSLMLLFISKKRREYLIGFLFIYLVLGLVSTFCIVFKWDTFFIINLINAILCGLCLVGVLIFGFGAMKEELQKKWHI